MHWEYLNAIECCEIRMMSGLTWIWIHDAQSLLTPQIDYSKSVFPTHTHTHTPFASWNCVCPCKEFLVLREGSFMAGSAHVLVVHHVHIMITCNTTEELHCTPLYTVVSRVLVIYTLTCTAHAILPTLQPFYLHFSHFKPGIFQLYMTWIWHTESHLTAIQFLTWRWV